MNRVVLFSGILAAAAVLTGCATPKNKSETESLVENVLSESRGVPDCGVRALAYCASRGSRIHAAREERQCACGSSSALTNPFDVRR